MLEFLNISFSKYPDEPAKKGKTENDAEHLSSCGCEEGCVGERVVHGVERCHAPRDEASYGEFDEACSSPPYHDGADGD